MKPYVIETLSPARLQPIHRICYAIDGLDALRAVLRAHPDEVLHSTVTESRLAGLPTTETWVGDPS